MKSKRRYWLLVVALIMPITFVGAHPGQRLAQEGADPATRKRINDDFIKAMLLAKDNYAGEVNYDRLAKYAITGMLQTLDPHSSYFDKKEWEDFQNDQRSRYSGIGSFIAQRAGKIYITSPFPGTPAHRAGIRYGDQIVAVNGESTEGLTSLQVSNKLLGPEGTPVTVRVQRLGVAEPLEFKLVRATVPRPSITGHFMVADGVGYVNLQNGFNTTTYEEMVDALEDLQKQGMNALILDLRGNRGGLVEQAWRVTNLFLYRGQKVISMRGRPGAFPSRDYYANNTSPNDYPLVVLINRGSASASEIVAGALQDHDRAQIVGENSFGKGLVQTVFQLNDGSGLTLTTGKYYTPSGRLIQREYAGRSFYDYYLQRGDKEAVQKTEKTTTDSGRTVYGGGGIDPDVEVKIPQRELELQRVWLEPAFVFVRHLVGGQIAGFPEYRLDRPADHSHRLQPNDYVVTDKVLVALKKFLSEHPDLKVDPARVDKDADWLKRWLRYEIVTAAYGQEVASQVLLQGDAQLLRAIAEVPKAKLMAEGIRRTRAQSRGGDVRQE